MKLWPTWTLGGIPFSSCCKGHSAELQFNPAGSHRRNFSNIISRSDVTRPLEEWMAPGDWISARQFDRITEAGSSDCLPREAPCAGGSTFELCGGHLGRERSRLTP